MASAQSKVGAVGNKLKKSKAQLEKERAAGLKKLSSKEQQEKAKEKKRQKKNPTRAKVFGCRCVSVRGVRIKSPGVAGPISTAGYYLVPIHLMTKGAEYQDQRYGKGKRLHNPGFVKGKLKGWTCTCCGERKNEEGM